METPSESQKAYRDRERMKKAALENAVRDAIIILQKALAEQARHRASILFRGKDQNQQCREDYFDAETT